MNMWNGLKYGAAFVVLIMFNGCASMKMQSWTNPEIGERPIGKVMVVAIVESPTTCRVFEGYFVEKLAEKGIEASSGHVVMQATEDISEELLMETLKTDGYDSVIITRLMSEDSQSQVVHAGYTSTPSFPGYYGHYSGFYSSSVISPVTYVDNFMEYVLETTLYDVESGTMVWGGLKSVYDTSSDSSNIKKVVKAVVGELNKEKLL
jgi:hypothetical protein